MTTAMLTSLFLSSYQPLLPQFENSMKKSGFLLEYSDYSLDVAGGRLTMDWVSSGKPSKRVSIDVAFSSTVHYPDRLLPELPKQYRPMAALNDICDRSFIYSGKVGSSIRFCSPFAFVRCKQNLSGTTSGNGVKLIPDTQVFATEGRLRDLCLLLYPEMTDVVRKITDARSKVKSHYQGTH